jgi:hypothetical protein
MLWRSAIVHYLTKPLRRDGAIPQKGSAGLVVRHEVIITPHHHWTDRIETRTGFAAWPVLFRSTIASFLGLDWLGHQLDGTPKTRPHRLQVTMSNTLGHAILVLPVLSEIAILRQVC